MPKPNRSEIQLVSVLASRMEQSYRSKPLVASLRSYLKALSDNRAEHSDHDDEEQRRIERQRSLFSVLPDVSSVERLRHAMKQRVYDLMWDGDTMGADALAEFLPDKDATEAFEAWESDTGGGKPRTSFYAGARNA